MANYHERLRDLDGTRYLLRDFLVNGFRTRNDLSPSQKRTYDNERRRVEALLGDTLQWQYGKKGKRYFVAADASRLSVNPLHRMYRLSSFTDNDIALHFYLLDALADGQPHDLAELLETVSDGSGIPFEEITVRRKLTAYTRLGLIRTEKQGSRTLYRAVQPASTAALPVLSDAAEWLSFFREALPFGNLADEIMLREDLSNRFIRFKHHFLMYTLDDIECLRLLEAIHELRAVSCTMEAKRADSPTYPVEILPVSIRISTQNGRRYLIGWDLKLHQPRALRLDLMHDVKPLNAPEDAAQLTDRTREVLNTTWGVSMPNREEPDTLSMTLRIDPVTEQYILTRLHREGRGGTVTQVGEDLFRYDITVMDAGEMSLWFRTFIGRIVSLSCSREDLQQHFYEDIRRMAEMYAGGDDDGTVQRSIRRLLCRH